MDLEKEDIEFLYSEGITPEFICDEVCEYHYNISEDHDAAGMLDVWEGTFVLSVTSYFSIMVFTNGLDLKNINFYVFGIIEQLLKAHENYYVECDFDKKCIEMRIKKYL